MRSEALLIQVMEPRLLVHLTSHFTFLNTTVFSAFAVTNIPLPTLLELEFPCLIVQLENDREPLLNANWAGLNLRPLSNNL